MALNPGANQYTGPACGAKKCFIAAAAAGDITTRVNKGRQAGAMSSLLLLDVYVTARVQNDWGQSVKFGVDCELNFLSRNLNQGA